VLASEYQNSGSKFQVSAKDRQKRVDKIFALRKQANVVQALYENYINNKGAMMVDEEQPMIRNKGADGETDQTRDLTSEQILQQQRNHMGKQDEKVDELIAITGTIAGTAQDQKTMLTD
jgi:hypothetical protein